jgi:hypothetical protein
MFQYFVAPLKHKIAGTKYENEKALNFSLLNNDEVLSPN